MVRKNFMGYLYGEAHTLCKVITGGGILDNATEAYRWNLLSLLSSCLRITLGENWGAIIMWLPLVHYLEWVHVKESGFIWFLINFNSEMLKFNFWFVWIMSCHFFLNVQIYSLFYALLNRFSIFWNICL